MFRDGKLVGIRFLSCFICVFIVWVDVMMWVRCLFGLLRWVFRFMKVIVVWLLDVVLLVVCVDMGMVVIRFLCGSGLCLLRKCCSVLLMMKSIVLLRLVWWCLWVWLRLVRGSVMLVKECVVDRFMLKCVCGVGLRLEMVVLLCMMVVVWVVMLVSRLCSLLIEVLVMVLLSDLIVMLLRMVVVLGREWVSLIVCFYCCEMVVCSMLIVLSWLCLWL